MPEHENINSDERRTQEYERRVELSKDAQARGLMELVGCSYQEARDSIEKLFEQHKRSQIDRNNELDEAGITEENI